MEGLVFLIPLSAIGLAWFATFLKHKEKMAGVGTHGGGGDPALRQTVQLLTETLEKQHERQQGLVKRLEALEAIVTAERLPEPPAALGLGAEPPDRASEIERGGALSLGNALNDRDDDDRDADPAVREAATEPIRPRVRPEASAS